jgi:hypothetical protein
MIPVGKARRPTDTRADGVFGPVSNALSGLPLGTRCGDHSPLLVPMVDLPVCFDGLLPRVASIDDHLELARLNRLFAEAGYLTGLALES